ncbi:MAG: acyl-CoA dehydrogenase family protein, partial [Oleiphilaceae bacterium]|nr:acyl-CoA dehydrogenase family protein [Oleiphilaceae bacterium]
APDMKQWYHAFCGLTQSQTLAFDRATLGGVTSQCVAFAFVAGYQSAIEQLFGEKDQRLSSLCVTEAEGNHPRAIKSLLEQKHEYWLLSGSKQFVSGAEDAQRLFVACNTGCNASGNPRIKIVRIDLPHEGVCINALPELSFIPEVSHGKVVFENVKVTPDAVLEGDGYSDFVKPFRTAEDIHVLGAVLAFRLGLGLRQAWSPALLEEHLALLGCLRQLAQLDYKAPMTHLQLAGVRHQLSHLIASSDATFEAADPAAYVRWQRDRSLLKVAMTAHEKRTEKAWQNLMP